MVAAAPPAISSHYLVRADGSGDFPTIGAAIDYWNSTHVVDSILVAPGDYDEVINFAEPFNCSVASTDGPEATRIRGFTSVPESGAMYQDSYGAITGFTIDEPVKFGGNTWYANWYECVFQKGFHGMVADGRWPNFRECTFRDTSSFIGYGYDAYDCRFENAPAFIRNALGYVAWHNCTFSGAASALTTVEPHDQSQIAFFDCTFSGSTQAIAVFPKTYYPQMVWVKNCRFDSIPGSAVFYEYGDWKQWEFAQLTITVDDSRFADCGQMAHLYAPGPIELECTRDTVVNCSGTAIEGTVQMAGLDGVRIDGAGGDGIHWILQSQYTSQWTDYAKHSIQNCSIRNSRGNGITMIERPDAPIDLDEGVVLRNNTIERNDGSGAWLESAAPTITNSLMRRNRDDGIHLALQGMSPTCSLAVNTAVENGRDGLAIESVRMATPITLTNNLFTGNTANGLRMPAAYTGEVSRNNAWANLGVPYSGLHPGDTQMQLDPLYCAASAGDFELRADSPCGPSGTCGQIGAFGVGCGAASVVATAAPAAFHLAPNPARGAVAFSWPATRAPESLEVLDVQGRVRWRAAAGGLANGSLHWDGLDSSGRKLSAGIYFARWKSAGETRAARLVWLGD